MRNREFAKELLTLSQQRMLDLEIKIKALEDVWPSWQLKWVVGLYKTNKKINEMAKEVLGA